MEGGASSPRERPNKLQWSGKVTRAAIYDAFLHPEMRFLFGFLVTAALSLSTSRADLLGDAMLSPRAEMRKVTIPKRRKFLAPNPAPSRAEAANILLARCLIETQKTREASEVLDRANGPEADFLRAQEALRSRRWKEAVDRFALLSKTPGPFLVEAK